LLSGLAAISSAYPPDLTIHPGAAGTSHERKTPIFLQKTRAEPDYNEGRKRTQGQMSKKGRKNAILLGACAKRAEFMRLNVISGRIWARLGCVMLPNSKLIKEKRL
jgi:hypothetical protein